MFRGTKGILFISLFLSQAGFAFAVQPPLALQILIRDTLSSHPLVASRRAAVESAQYASSAAERQFLPTPALNVEQTLYESDFSGGGTSALSGGLRLDMPVYTGGRLTGQLAQARSREQLVRSELALSNLTLALRVVEAWSGWVAAYLNVQAYSESVRQHERLLGFVQRRSEQGFSAPADVEFARLRLQTVQSGLVLANTQLGTSLKQLRIVSGHSAVRELPLPVQVMDLENAIAWVDAQGADLLAKSIQQSPQLMRARSVIDESSAAVDVAKSSDRPNISLSVEKRFGGIDIENLQRGDRGRIFLGMTTQFGAGFSHQLNHSRLLSQLESDRQLGLVEERELTERIEVDMERLVGAQRKIDSLLLAIKSSEFVFSSWERQFLEGHKQWQDLMNAASEKLQLQAQLAEAKASVQLSGWRLYLTCEGVEVALGGAGDLRNE